MDSTGQPRLGAGLVTLAPTPSGPSATRTLPATRTASAAGVLASLAALPIAGTLHPSTPGGWSSSRELLGPARPRQGCERVRRSLRADRRPWPGPGTPFAPGGRGATDQRPHPGGRRGDRSSPNGSGRPGPAISREAGRRALADFASRAREQARLRGPAPGSAPRCIRSLPPSAPTYTDPGLDPTPPNPPALHLLDGWWITTAPPAGRPWPKDAAKTGSSERPPDASAQSATWTLPDSPGAPTTTATPSKARPGPACSLGRPGPGRDRPGHRVPVVVVSRVRGCHPRLGQPAARPRHHGPVSARRPGSPARKQPAGVWPAPGLTARPQPRQRTRKSIRSMPTIHRLDDRQPAGTRVRLDKATERLRTVGVVGCHVPMNAGGLVLAGGAAGAMCLAGAGKAGC